MQEGIAQNRRNCQRVTKSSRFGRDLKRLQFRFLGNAGSCPNSHRLLLSEREPEFVSVWLSITSVRSRYKNDNGPL
jgi:hypothetical protein